MFRTILPNKAALATQRIEFDLDGVAHSVSGELSVAAALLLVSAGLYRRSSVDGSSRAPHCLMGVCGECLVTIDGKRNQFGCQVALRHGMRIETQRS